jgi:hypothetical protein
LENLLLQDLLLDPLHLFLLLLLHLHLILCKVVKLYLLHLDFLVVD